MLSMYRQFGDMRLEVCINPRDVLTFQRRYMAATGEAPQGDGFNVRASLQFGVNPRVYFNGSEVLLHNLRMMGFRVEDDAVKRGYRGGEYAHRVTDTVLFWRLVALGHRIGNNVTVKTEAA